jgi:hypothetical protein
LLVFPPAAKAPLAVIRIVMTPAIAGAKRANFRAIFVVTAVLLFNFILEEMAASAMMSSAAAHCGCRPGRRAVGRLRSADARRANRKSFAAAATEHARQPSLGDLPARHPADAFALCITRDRGAALIIVRAAVACAARSEDPIHRGALGFDLAAGMGSAYGDSPGKGRIRKHDDADENRNKSYE